MHRLAPFVLALLLAACAPLPPSPQDIAAKRFEPVAGQSVIYLVRTYPDFTRDAATLWLDDRVMGSTYPGTYFRWVVPPGRHKIAGFAGDSGYIVLDTAPGQLYFVRQTVGHVFGISVQSHFQPVDDNWGRGAVMNSELAG
jgi:hypothetical protein